MQSWNLCGFLSPPPSYRPVTAGVSILNTTSGIEYPRSPLQRRGHSRDVVRPNPMAAVEHRGALPGPRGGLHFETREAVSGSSSLQPERVTMEGLGTSQSGRFVMCRYRGGGWVGVGGYISGFQLLGPRVLLQGTAAAASRGSCRTHLVKPQPASITTPSSHPATHPSPPKRIHLIGKPAPPPARRGVVASG